MGPPICLKPSSTLRTIEQAHRSFSFPQAKSLITLPQTQHGIQNPHPPGQWMVPKSKAPTMGLALIPGAARTH